MGGTQYISSLSIIIAAIGVYLFSVTHHLWLILMARVLMGAGAAFATVSYLKMAVIFFDKKYYAVIAGFLTVGVMIGALCGQAPLAYLIKHSGWQHSTLIISGIGCIIAICYLLFPKNQTTPTSSHFFAGLLLIMKKKHNWCLLMYSGFAFAPLAVFGSLWGIPFIQASDHLSTIRASEMVSWLYIGFGVGGVVFGCIAKASQRLYPSMFIGLAVSFISLCVFVYSGLTNHIIQSMCLLFLGIGTGAFMLGFNLGKNLNQILLAATVVAFINTGDAFLGGITDPIIGKILDVTHSGHKLLLTDISMRSYHLAFMILPLYLLVSVFFLLKVKIKYSCKKQQIALEAAS
jgi:MFS family permease